ncbi:alpha/beta fold hydrolase [Naasia sp. SYSU D00057]|uniref:alpha/beta fold hydrolase n=1 Tax=Naasia sp. SYSU D00057 TaxID=2817380 RepID=UPI001FEF56EC|nr:alpha/beta hydrolase [Naasia sp. SYSU D00057]
MPSGTAHRAEAVLFDGSRIPFTVAGNGPAVLLPVRVEPFEEAAATTLRAWGGDPDLGPALVAALAQGFTVVAADYEGHRMATPAEGGLVPDALASDLLAIADAAGASSFAYYGYSWLAVAGLQLAIRTDRLWALAMGGYPPVDGPYAAMLAVTRAAHEKALAPTPPPPIEAVEPGDWDAAGVGAGADVTGQFVALYEHLQGFDDRAAALSLRIPRLAFAGDADDIAYGEGWGDTVVRIAEPLARTRAELEAAGWEVEVLPGLDHLGAMHSAAVLPVLAPWLDRHRPDPATTDG